MEVLTENFRWPPYQERLSPNNPHRKCQYFFSQAAVADSIRTQPCKADSSASISPATSAAEV